MIQIGREKPKQPHVPTKDEQIEALQKSGAMMLMEMAQHNKELTTQKMTNAQLLIEVSKLKSQLETLQGGGE